jgi:hypothetical protein
MKITALTEARRRWLLARADDETPEREAGDTVDPDFAHDARAEDEL